MPIDDSNAELRDDELPDESDMSPDEDGASIDLEPCPFCGKEIYETADICHHCGSFVSRETPRLRAAWIIVLIFAAAAMIAAGVMFGR